MIWYLIPQFLKAPTETTGEVFLYLADCRAAKALLSGIEQLSAVCEGVVLW